MNTTSASLLERLRQPGEEEAWERFLALYTPLLYYWACRFGLQPEDVSDLVQEVLLALVRKLPEFVYDPNRSFRSWLRRILHNKCCDFVRRRKANPVHEKLHGLEALVDPAAIDSYWESEYREHLVGRALELIRVDFQESTWKAFWAVVVDDLSPGEAADKLGIRVDAVYTAKSRVLRRLRLELRGFLD